MASPPREVRRTDAFAGWLTRHARLVLGTGLVGLLALATGLGQVEVETHAERFLAPDHPTRVRYEAFKDDFGLDTAVFVLIESEDVFAPDFLARLDDFHDSLESELPHLDRVRSLASARLMEGEDDWLRVSEVRDELPRTDGDARRLEAQLRETTAYPGQLFSRDGRTTAVGIHLDAYESADDDGTRIPISPRTAGDIVQQIRDIAARHWPSDAVQLAGNPVVNASLAAAFARDLLRYTAIALFAIASCLVLLFRRVGAVVLPLAIVLVSIAATLGAAGHLGWTLNVAVQILPPFLLAIGASASLHILVLFYRRLDAGVSRAEAVAAALGHAGPAMLFTSATTAVGLGSFAMATDLAPIALLGRLAPIGVGLTLFAAIVLLPAALVLLPAQGARTVRVRDPRATLTRGLTRAGLAGLASPRRVALGVALAVAVSAAGVVRLEAANDALAYFPDGDPIRVATARFDERLSGSLGLEVLVDTGRAGGLHDPRIVAALDAFGSEVTRLEGEGGARITAAHSVVDVLREIHEALADPGPEESALPTERALVAQELLLFESSGAEDLAHLVEPDASRARLTLRAPWLPAQHYRTLVPRVEALLREHLPTDARIATTGLIVVFAEAVDAISRGFVVSYGAALIMITLLMMIFVRSPRAGLASMVPNVLPIALTLGIMGWTGIPLDLFTMLIGSIAIGLAVDDTVHLTHAFQTGWARHGDVERAVRDGLETTGSAILTSSLVLCLGFGSFAFSPMANLVDFGLLTSLAIALALVIDVLVLPPIFAWSVERKASRDDLRDAPTFVHEADDLTVSEHPALSLRPGRPPLPGGGVLGRPEAATEVHGPGLAD